MAKTLDYDDSVALLKHYAIDVKQGHESHGIPVVFTGESTPEAAITATIGDRSSRRIVPISAFLAEGMVAELKDPHLKPDSQTGRAIIHLIEKISKMHAESQLVSFTLHVLLEGDHYEVVAKPSTISAPDKLKVPHRLTPHAHDKTVPHAPQRLH
jgi:hypothetical protein